VDKQTPKTPWSVGEFGKVYDAAGHHITLGGFRLATGGWNGEPEATDAFIIEAVNSHAALLERDKVLREALMQIRDGVSDCGCECNDENCCAVIGEFCPRCIARAALAAGSAAWIGRRDV